jgi:hypothetical protein
MIRCIPIDGSAPFEVENRACIYGSGVAVEILSYSVDARQGMVSNHSGKWVDCRIESWRERAERLEKELAGLRHKIALDAMDKRREYEHP